MPAPYWNHNTHYFGWVLDQVPSGCDLAVDLGCGDGLLLGRLADRAQRAVGVEVDAEMASQARRNLRGRTNVSVHHTSFIDWDAADGSVAFVSASASLHHVDLEVALTRIERLLEPGGVLAVVGLCREASPLDYVCGAASLLPIKVLNRWHGLGGPSAPVRDPVLSWAETRQTFYRLLPGTVFRRRLAWRYTACWTKPR